MTPVRPRQGKRPPLRERSHHIRERFEEKLRPLTLPNFVTMIRMAMVPFLVIAINDHDFRLALAIFVLAGLTDALDGALARRLKMQSLTGALLDPIADKILLTTAYVTLTFPQGQAVVIPLWLTIVALFRDVLIVVMAVVLYVVENVRRFPPSFWGKATTFMHVVTVTVVLLANLVSVPRIVPVACFYLSFAAVIISGFHYIYRSSRALETARQERENQR